MQFKYKMFALDLLYERKYRETKVVSTFGEKIKEPIRENEEEEEKSNQFILCKSSETILEKRFYSSSHILWFLLLVI